MMKHIKADIVIATTMHNIDHLRNRSFISRRHINAIVNANPRMKEVPKIAFMVNKV